MARLIQEKIKKPLANDLLFGKLAHGGHVRIYVENDEVAFAIESNELIASEASFWDNDPVCLVRKLALSCQLNWGIPHEMMWWD